ncbi:GNAT family N-acetyltransferase [Microbacterium sp. cx-59]|uniref:GNAT family N-acetyltransferase n=1 Tax=Microbacterium sp. cx-59 TaxID=2891207 RepID=UPI001E4BBF85|nr:GNAT family N-acetyltransferase [Microbacterium sp. cx-59]MCC4906750.1 GNAT family N-acetyltransferase [Microbacterium sp. cx-59]
MDDTFVNAHHDMPADPASAARVARRGLRLTRLRNDDLAEFAAWQRSVTRGFLEGERTEVQRDTGFDLLRYRRLIAVLDDSAPEPDEPVATFASWVGVLSVPGGQLPSCGISGVTVSPTHRRRGLARAMMEGELRVAVESGLPIASLTVTESTIYGRYGFAPAASVASLELDVKRTSWAGPVPDGRIDFISRDRWRAQAPEVFDRIRAVRPGEFEMPGGHWDRFAGTRPDAEKPGQLRAIQYADVAGVVRGLALYTVTENDQDYTKSSVTLHSLLADGDDAYAALWRYFVELDLIATVRASELSIDEPLLWMISDRRAATVTTFDHHYLRVLDVPAVLGARRYAAPGRFVLDVDDPFGFTTGEYTLDVDADGAGTVQAGDAGAEGSVRVQLGVAELSALVLGQVSAVTLAAAGRIRTADAVALDRTFRWDVPARLSYWY